jgi:hypothetical protein
MLEVTGEESIIVELDLIAVSGRGELAWSACSLPTQVAPHKTNEPWQFQVFKRKKSTTSVVDWLIHFTVFNKENTNTRSD